MKTVRIGALIVLAAVAICALCAPLIAPFPFDRQFRESPDAPPGGRFLLGTDEIGRDRLSRLVYATRTSVLLAPAAAAISIALAFVMSVARPKALVSGFATVCLSLPWLFVFIVLRATLPLNTSPGISVAVTFALMGVAGWALPARVFSALMTRISESGWMLQSRAAGIGRRRLFLVCQWPHLRAVAAAQFRALLPACILAEASLGLLGLGVAEPLPSWGNLLQDLQKPDLVAANPLVLLPLALLMLVMICLELI